MKVTVIGAGAFGGWTALHLARRGARVTLIDAWGPGNARSSSGGDTRVIRATYGRHARYTAMARRGMRLWRDYDAAHGAGLMRTTGVLWMVSREDGFARASQEALRQAGLRLDELTIAEAAARFPQVSFDGIASVLWETDAGYLFARRACAHVVARFVAEGGEYRQAAVAVPVDVNRVDLDADAVVFACGPWLGGLFPDVVGARVQATRQEVYYFGTPAGDARFQDPAMPVWLDYGERVFYGIPGDANRGFKIADDTSGPAIDPTSASRDATPSGVAAVRERLAQRFPDLADAPLLASEVCQYEATPDAHFILDRHPAHSRAWIAGGGSGHGFKMGPVVGELLASAILDDVPLDPQFSLSRFAAPPPGGWQAKWA